MAEINREILLPYMQAYIPYLDKQEKKTGGRLLSNAEEDYKRTVAAKANVILNSESWLESEIGSGVIRDRVFKAVQAHVNLVGRFQISSFNDKVNENLEQAESVFYDFYHNHKEKECFDQLCGIFGRTYNIVAYLYFINNPARYLPVKPQFFDKIFNRLQIDFKTYGRCSWENYQEFIDIVSAVRDYMQEYYQEVDIDLLDAHSFLWTIDQGVLDEVVVEDQEKAVEDIEPESDSDETTVYHKEYGAGSIVRIANDNVYVKFGDGEYIFQYPEAFERGYLREEGKIYGFEGKNIKKESVSVIEGSPAWFLEKSKVKQKVEYEKYISELRKDFIDLYNPDKLQRMSGRELLGEVFGDGNTMLTKLTEDKDYRKFGAAGTYKYLRIVYEKNEGWAYYKGNKAVQITEDEAMQRAGEIRDQLLIGANAIDGIKSFDSISKYIKLDETLQTIYFSTYTWALKYYQMIYPEVFPGMYADHTIDRAISILGLPKHKGNRVLNMGEIALFINRCGVSNIVFNSIYSDHWTWGEDREPSEYAMTHSRVSSQIK